MSDGPRDAERWFGQKRVMFRGEVGETLTATEAASQYAKGVRALIEITKGDATRILDRYRKVPVGELKDEELYMILKLKAFVGE